MTRCASEDKHPVQGLRWTPPDPIRCELDAERIIVRSYRLDDAPALFEAINESRDDHLLPWMVWAKDNHRTIESTTKYICDQILALEQTNSFTNVGTGVFCKQTGRLLGGSGVDGVYRDTASCETGYWIRKSAAGNGYAREACARTISWALAPQDQGGLGLERVRIFCSAANKASARTIEKLGITAEVFQRRDFFVEGIGPTDRLGWGVLKHEWDHTNHRAIEQSPTGAVTPGSA